MKQVAFRVVAVALATALPLGAVEAGLRLFGRETRLEREAESARTRSIWIASTDEVLVYRNRSDYFRAGERMTESHGILRQEEASVEKTPGKRRVIVLGDSVAAGLDVRYEERFATRLESLLKGTEVLNFAVNGYRTTQEARLLEKHAARFDPDLIVLQYCLNDPGNSITPTVWFERNRPSGSRLIRRITGDPRESYFVPTFGPDYGKADYWLRLYEPGSASWRSVEDSLQAIGAYACKKGIRAVMVIFPLLLEDGWQRPRVAPFHRQVQKAGEKAGFEVIDLLDAYEKRTVAELQIKAGDIYHPNGEGHRIAAEALAARIGPRAPVR